MLPPSLRLELGVHMEVRGDWASRYPCNILYGQQICGVLAAMTEVAEC